MTYAEGERASSDIGTLNVSRIVLGPVDVAPTSIGWLPRPWKISWTTGSGAPDTSVRAVVVESRYGASDWPAVVIETTVRWPPTNAAALTARLPRTAPDALSFSI